MAELTSDETCARNILKIFEAEKTAPDEMMIIGAVAIKYRERFSGVDDFERGLAYGIEAGWFRAEDVMLFLTQIGFDEI